MKRKVRSSCISSSANFKIKYASLSVSNSNNLKNFLFVSNTWENNATPNDQLREKGYNL